MHLPPRSAFAGAFAGVTAGVKAGVIAACAALLPALATAADPMVPLAHAQASAILAPAQPAIATTQPALAPAQHAAVPTQRALRANFADAPASEQARKLADWVVHSANNADQPFIIVDKVQAQVFVFDPQGQLRGATPALVGSAPGDDSVPGIGERKLSSIRPHERTTAAGRFKAYLDRDIKGKPLMWVDYDSALSLHPVVKGTPRERRAERLASPTPLDNRISFGCINVPVAFYTDVVNPTFTGTYGIVYILPETRTSHEVFGSYDVEDAPPVTNPAKSSVAAGKLQQAPN